MKVLLLHPEDKIPSGRFAKGWDLVADFGRAPASTYEKWGRETGCRVISVYDFAEGIEDLRRMKDLLRAGMGSMVDCWGVDWWDVLSVMFYEDLQQLILLQRLAKEVGLNAELHTSRPDFRASALQAMLGGKLISCEGRFGKLDRWIRHHSEASAHLNGAQIVQVLQDKFDPQHMIRRRLVQRRRVSSPHPTVLLPSAYVNVSRAAISYAQVLPEDHFLLVYTRRNARLVAFPSNVQSAPLDAYFKPVDRVERQALLDSWRLLKPKLVSGAEEFKILEACGGFNKVPGLLNWGTSIRDAWNHVFDSEDIQGCLSADDSNPYTRIPLVLARKRGIPTLACHHGALDYFMAVKTQYADFYLAKTAMEQDYLVRICGLDPEKIVASGREPAASVDLATTPREKKWFVFFTEPYQAQGRRIQEVYRELFPLLFSLAENCGLQLVFKLHPFESVRGYRHLLKQVMGAEKSKQAQVVGGFLSPDDWQQIRFAMTVQSTVALECVKLGIPVFLCAWLGSSYSGYLQQYEKFGIGRLLKAPGEICKIPDLLKTYAGPAAPEEQWQSISSERLRNLLIRAPESSTQPATKASGSTNKLR